jgi:hypothetical protein
MGDAAAAAGRANQTNDNRNENSESVKNARERDAEQMAEGINTKEVDNNQDMKDREATESHNRDAAMEESNPDAASRRPSRKRSSIKLSRYSPGEGGGLKRQKTEKTPHVGIAEEGEGRLKSPPIQIVLQSSGEKSDKKKKDGKKKEKLESNASKDQQSEVMEMIEGKKKKEGMKKTEKLESDALEQQDVEPTKSGNKLPTYKWGDEGTKSSGSTEHQSLSIDFGAGFSEDTTPTSTPPDGSWKCVKCFNTNIAAKARCGVCMSWKGGKRENYRRGSVDSTASTGGGGNVAPSNQLVIRAGDDVLISSGDAPWKDLNRLIARAEVLKEKEDVSICYDDPASSELGLGVLDPYVVPGSKGCGRRQRMESLELDRRE